MAPGVFHLLSEGRVGPDSTNPRTSTSFIPNAALAPIVLTEAHPHSIPALHVPDGWQWLAAAPR